MSNRRFNGFPAGEMRFCRVPDLVFADLVPQINSLAELKVTLHFLWQHTRHARHFLTWAELRADETLSQSLALIQPNLDQTLGDALQRAVERGTLLYTQIQNEQGTHDLYFLNSERGRLTHQKYETGQLGLVTITHEEALPPTERPNIYKLYEQNIGPLSPIIAEMLQEAEQTYPEEWIQEAFEIAVESNVRRWRYIRAILEKMASGEHHRPNAGDDNTWYTSDEFQAVILS